MVTKGLEDLRQRLTPALPSSQEDYPYSDAFNALVLVRRHGHVMRYCSPWKVWLLWTGTHWQRETCDVMMRWQRETLHRLWDVGATWPKAQIKRLQRHITRSLNTGKLKAAVEQAKSWEGITLGQEGLDANIWALHCANGTLDLRTSVLRPHQQDDLLTKCLDLDYDPTATCPTWEKFLGRSMGASQGQDDPDTMGAGEMENRRLADAYAATMMAFLQRCIGYALTGSTRE